MIVLFTILAAFVALSTQDDSWRCGPVAARGDNWKLNAGLNKCYSLTINPEVYWAAAGIECGKKIGPLGRGRIVQPHTSAEVAHLSRWMYDINYWRNGVWAGLHRPNGNWGYANGDSFRDDGGLWGPGEPSYNGVLSFMGGRADCAYMKKSDGWKLASTYCSKHNFKYSFICEYDALPTITSTSTTPTSTASTSSTPSSTSSTSSTTTATTTTNATTESAIATAELLKMRALADDSVAAVKTTEPTTTSTPMVNSFEGSFVRGDEVAAANEKMWYEGGEAFWAGLSIGLLFTLIILMLLLFLYRNKRRRDEEERRRYNLDSLSCETPRSTSGLSISGFFMDKPDGYAQGSDKQGKMSRFLSMWSFRKAHENEYGETNFVRNNLNDSLGKLGALPPMPTRSMKMDDSLYEDIEVIKANLKKTEGPYDLPEKRDNHVNEDVMKNVYSDTNRRNVAPVAPEPIGKETEDHYAVPTGPAEHPVDLPEDEEAEL